MARGETLEVLKRTDPEGRLLLEQEQQIRQARVNSAPSASECWQLEGELAKARSELLHFDLKLLAEHFRLCEQKLKETISWYTPLEELIGIPVIGANWIDFMDDVRDCEGMRVELDGRLIRLYVASRSEPPPGYFQHRAIASLYRLHDGTLRPQQISDYQNLFRDIQPLFESSGIPISNPVKRMNIGFIGRYVQRSGYDLDPIHETMAVDRHNMVSHYPHNGYVEVYDQNGKRQSLKPYEADYSDKLK